MSSRRCNSCASGCNWHLCTVLTTVAAPFRLPCWRPSRPTDLTTVFDRRSVGLLWRSEIIGTVGDKREVATDAVRVMLVAVGLVTLLAILYLMSIGVSAVFGFQRADDYGEVARQVASGMSGAIRTGNQVDARVLQVANQLSSYRQAQLTDSQRSQPAATTWAMGEQEPADADAVFRRVD